MTERNRAAGCLVGLACGDALGRPVEFRTPGEIEEIYGEVSEMLGDGTHQQPAGTVTDDTEMALCLAESLTARSGFAPEDVARRFANWLETDPFDIGSMTRDALIRLQRGEPWHEAGQAVFEARSEGRNAGNGSIMRCAPHALAFRHFEPELTHVSRLSSAITHADPRCQWGCVLLNRTIANLVRGVENPLDDALSKTWDVPDELLEALSAVQECLHGERDASALEAELAPTGYVVDTLQMGLYFGLTADSAQAAISAAVNCGGDTDTIGAVTGAVAGARFGIGALPDRWVSAIDEATKMRRLARRLLAIRLPVPGKRYVTTDDGELIFKERTVSGPTYIPASAFQPTRMGHRPHPAPHHTVGVEYRDLTPARAAMVDWERRAYAASQPQNEEYLGDAGTSTLGIHAGNPAMVPVPQYAFAKTFKDLPTPDQRRIERDVRAAGESFVRAFAAFAGVRYPIVEMGTEPIGIERMNPIAGATRSLVGPFGDLGETLFDTSAYGGYDSPADIREAFEGVEPVDGITTQPARVPQAFDQLEAALSGSNAVLDYLTHLRTPKVDGNVASKESISVNELRQHAREAVAELHVVRESLHRVAIRHPEIDREE